MGQAISGGHSGNGNASVTEFFAARRKIKELPVAISPEILPLASKRKETWILPSIPRLRAERG